MMDQAIQAAKMLLTVLGVSNITIDVTDNDPTKIELGYDRHGQHHRHEITLTELRTILQDAQGTL